MVVGGGSKMPEAERSNRLIPPEIVEEILVNLPMKSLLRFSTVSKSWNSMIFDEFFVTKHKSSAARPGREKILISHSLFDSLSLASSRSLSSISPNQTTDDSAPLICPFKRESVLTYSPVRLLASCGELWCVQHAADLLLWNPSMGTFTKLPFSFEFGFASGLESFSDHFCFGLGYDSFSDDYKILKICPFVGAAALYSLRSNSWRKIQPFPLKRTPRGNGVFLRGALHWLAYHPDPALTTVLQEFQLVIISFDLSTEKYAEMAPPPYYLGWFYDQVELAVVRGKLCVHVNSYNLRFSLWVMHEYGVGESWSKMFEIYLSKLAPYIKWRKNEWGGSINLIPLYFYDNGKILIRVTSVADGVIFIYMDEQSEPEIVLGRHTNSLLYVESLVSPATYCRPRRRTGAVWPTSTETVRTQSGNVRASTMGFGSLIFYYLSKCLI